MNFFISIIGWFLWNWAEFSITKEKGDGYSIVQHAVKIVDDYPIGEIEKKGLTDKLLLLVTKGITLREYAKSHYETWIGSFVCIFALMIIGYRQLDINPLGNLIGMDVTNGWNDLYLFGSGAAWDMVIFAFKKIKERFSK